MIVSINKPPFHHHVAGADWQINSPNWKSMGPISSLGCGWHLAYTVTWNRRLLVLNIPDLSHLGGWISGSGSGRRCFPTCVCFSVHSQPHWLDRYLKKERRKAPTDFAACEHIHVCGCISPTKNRLLSRIPCSTFNIWWHPSQFYSAESSEIAT